MRTRAGLGLVFGLVLASCGGAPAVSPSSEPAPAAPTATPAPMAPGDCADPPDVAALIEERDPLACYGNRDLVFEAEITVIMGVFDCPSQPEPAWLACSVGAELRPIKETSGALEFVLAARTHPRPEGPGMDPRPALSAALHPQLGPLRQLAGEPAVVTGHFDDPAALECRELGTFPGEEPAPREEIVQRCRSTFVIIALEPLEIETEPTAEPSSAFVPGSIAQAVETDIVIRSAPGTGSDSKIYPDLVSAPTLLYVFDGPVEADGYEWYEVIPANLDYLPSPYGLGWIAAAGKDGTPWIGPAMPDCPDPTLDAVAGLSGTARIACYGSEEITLEGELVGCDARDPIEDGSGEAVISVPWKLACTIQTEGCCPDVVPYAGQMTVTLAADVTDPALEPGTIVSVTGSFDAPSASTCETTAERWVDSRLQRQGDVPPDGWAVYLCRQEFVATSVLPTPGR